MQVVAVVNRHGIPLMPTSPYRARKLLKSGRAVIHKHRPVFTIRMTDVEEGHTQPVEYKCDTGYQHIGLSVCSEKHEFMNRQHDLLPDEAERHNDKRKYRCTRRKRLRYRKPRWNNRKGTITEDGFAPSIRNKRDRHVDLYKEITEVMPVTKAVFEMGQFDTQILKALEEGKPLPEGTDYQQGERYGCATLREAIFSRDHYTCIACGRNAIKNKVILHVHHIGFWKGDHSDRVGNLGTVCHKCHTPKNHKPGGKLFGLDPKLKPFKGATFMTMVRWDMLKRLKKAVPHILVEVTYGAMTKVKRSDLRLEKSHGNDAYAMGDLHPKHRTETEFFQKRRRNNRILEKFYDAKYMDTRDGKKKSGMQLSCNRANRRESRHTEKDERIYRGHKVSKGRRSIRKERYVIRPGDRVLVDGKWLTAKGIQNLGAYLKLETGKVVSVSKVKKTVHAGGWDKIHAS